MYLDVKVVYPLKQGLKHGNIIHSSYDNYPVKVAYPLKQGLKLIIKSIRLLITIVKLR